MHKRFEIPEVEKSVGITLNVLRCKLPQLSRDFIEKIYQLRLHQSGRFTWSGPCKSDRAPDGDRIGLNHTPENDSRLPN